jgi:hypothetical protein
MMTAAAFTAINGLVRDRLGNDWTIRQATDRLHLIADLLADPREDGIGVEIGLDRIESLSRAIRVAKTQERVS